MFEARQLCSGYGEVTVLKALDFTVGRGIFAVLGANGAGKTTLLKTIAKLLPVTSGQMTFRDSDVTGLAPYQLAERGLAFVPQEHNIFPDLSVEENLSIGAFLGKRPKRERMEEIFEVFPDVAARIRQKAGTLSGGEAQMVAIGRALMQAGSEVCGGSLQPDQGDPRDARREHRACRTERHQDAGGRRPGDAAEPRWDPSPGGRG
jgi:branched-chain amino acid transport system ATP-binding protein